MNIPKSYEALAADLASEKIISKTLQGQKESYMMLADGRKFDLDAIQQRLTVAEQRAGELEGLLREALSAHGKMILSDPPQEAWKYHRISERISAALKPYEAGEGS